jgi:hypothetical protein
MEENYYAWIPDVGVREILSDDIIGVVMWLAEVYTNCIIFSGTGTLEPDASPLIINKIA